MTGLFSVLQRFGAYLGAILVVLVDQATKYLIQVQVPLHTTHPVIEGFFNITHVRNPGAAFGFLAQAGPVWRFAFLGAVTLAVMVAIVIYLERTRRTMSTMLYTSLALILGGAAGNFIDRIIHREVIDFLDFYIRSWHWPAFNIADMAISAGAFLLIVDTFLKREEADHS